MKYVYAIWHDGSDIPLKPGNYMCEWEHSDTCEGRWDGSKWNQGMYEAKSPVCWLEILDKTWLVTSGECNDLEVKEYLNDGKLPPVILRSSIENYANTLYRRMKSARNDAESKYEVAYMLALSFLESETGVTHDQEDIDNTEDSR